MEREINSYETITYEEFVEALTGIKINEVYKIMKKAVQDVDTVRRINKTKEKTENFQHPTPNNE